MITLEVCSRLKLHQYFYQRSHEDYLCTICVHHGCARGSRSGYNKQVLSSQDLSGRRHGKHLLEVNKQQKQRVVPRIGK